MNQNAQKQYIGQKIRFWRKKRKYTQFDLSELTGISQAMISNFERGYNNPSATQLAALARALQTSADDLLPINPQDWQQDYVADASAPTRL